MNAGNTADIDEQGEAAMADTQFTILVDPPNCTWEQSSDGVIYWLHACAKMLQRIDPDDELTRNEAFQVAKSVLLHASDMLVNRMGLSPCTEDKIREVIQADADEQTSNRHSTREGDIAEIMDFMQRPDGAKTFATAVREYKERHPELGLNGGET